MSSFYRFATINNSLLSCKVIYASTDTESPLITESENVLTNTENRTQSHTRRSRHSKTEDDVPTVGRIEGMNDF